MGPWSYGTEGLAGGPGSLMDGGPPDPRPLEALRSNRRPLLNLPLEAPGNPPAGTVPAPLPSPRSRDRQAVMAKVRRDSSHRIWAGSGLITQRSLVQIQPPQPEKARD